MNTRLLRQTTLSAALALASFSSAHAIEYAAIDTAHSSIAFTYQQMGVKMEGGFDAIEAPEFNFDPAAPEKASVVLQIPLAGIDVGTEEANAEVEKSEWLNTPAHPLARFESNSVQALGDNRYQVTGKLAIKGHEQAVTAAFTLDEKDGTALFTGAFILKRGDFGIGEGDWSDFSSVANDIQITFNVVAKP